MSQKRRMKKLKQKARRSRRRAEQPLDSGNQPEQAFVDDGFVDDKDDDYDDQDWDSGDWEDDFAEIFYHRCDCEYCELVRQEPERLSEILGRGRVEVGGPEGDYAEVAPEDDTPMLRHLLNQAYRGFVYENCWAEMVHRHGLDGATELLSRIELEIRVVAEPSADDPAAGNVHEGS